MKKIADISQHDHPIDWNLARIELDLVIFRASIGTTIDKYYIQYAKESKVPYGVYHYVTATTAKDSREQARFFVDSANKAYKKPLFYIADIEGDRFDSENTEPVCVAFLEELRKLGCKKIGLYINRKYKYAGKAINMCDIIWIPHWGKNDGNIPGDAGKPKYYNDLWQYTSQGTLAGLNEDVDLNLLNGNKTLDYFIEGWDLDKQKEDESTQKTEVISMTIKKGANGENVKIIQQKLKDLGYEVGTVDGIFGDKTKKAVKTFQEDKGLSVDGIVGPKTIAALGVTLVEEKESSKQEDITGEIPHISGTAKIMDWWTSDIQKIFPRGGIAIITDVDTGISWREKRFAGTNHADIQPLTKEDTAKLKKVYGGSWSWKRRAVFVTIDGVNYAASIHGMPHGGSNLNNNFPGHHCCHFLSSRTHETNKVDENHQKMIQKAAKAVLK